MPRTKSSCDMCKSDIMCRAEEEYEVDVAVRANVMTMSVQMEDVFRHDDQSFGLVDGPLRLNKGGASCMV